MRLLVTGGAGYIGTHTCVALQEAGYEVAVLDNFSNSSPEALARVRALTGAPVPCYPADLLDAPRLEEVLDEARPEAVLHFAALKAVGESVAQPARYYRNNVVGTLNLCDAMARHGVKTLVFSSSATVYGDPEAIPIPETAPLGATNPYGWSKVIVERMLQDLVTADPTWRVASLRYFNPVGAHPSGEIGEAPNGTPTNLFPFITQVLAGRLERLRVFGGDYPTPDGSGVRDYIHVMDLARGHVRALERLQDHQPGDGYEVYNLGTGRGYSVLEVIRAFEQETGRRIPYEIVARRPGDIASCWADPAVAATRLGWTATLDLPAMCRDAWRWQSRAPNGYA